MSKVIYNNYLYLTNTREFNNGTLKNIFNRLLLFIQPTKKIKCPKIVFTPNNTVLESYYDESMDVYPLAWYDEETNTVVGNANKYWINSDMFEYGKNKYSKIYDEIIEYKGKYKYVIPLSDIYHELVHSVQYQSGIYQYTNLIEGADEILTFIITSHLNISYIQESIAIWYIARKVLKMDVGQFYRFVTDSIVDEDFFKKHLLLNKNFINLLSKDYNGNIDSFFKNIKSYGDMEYKEEFLRDINKINNIMFYRF